MEDYISARHIPNHLKDKTILSGMNDDRLKL